MLVNKQKRKKKPPGKNPTLLRFSVLMVVGYFSLTAFVDYQLEKKQFYGAYEDCHKIWSARGLYVSRVEQNSIESVKRAFSRGARGVEIDLFFDLQLKQFVISHDLPYRLKNGALLSLESLLDETGEGGYFWLDFKHLSRLNSGEVEEALLRLKTITAKNNLKEKIYVEGENPLNLSLFRKAGFKTILDVRPLPDHYFFSSVLMNVFKAVYYFGDFTVMGMQYGGLNTPIYGPDAKKTLRDVPVFLYHVPVDEPLLKGLSALQQVRVLLAGRDQSVDRFEINTCSDLT
ncbi:MAG: hypothetical protein ACE5FY_02390 [Nitrospiria bacterium]